MSEPQVRRRKTTPKRVFINNIDSYSSKNIAEFLCMTVIDEDDDEVEEISQINPALQVVGTVSKLSTEPRPYVLEEYCHPDREELLSNLMECHIVIYNISQDPEQVEEADWAVTALNNQKEDFSSLKLFILISTVMTWASSKPLDPEDPGLPFTDEIFYCRRAHPNFKKHIDLEKTVVKMGKYNREIFSTYVVASGLQYGMGEEIFHYFFKESWQGNKAEISLFGDGMNIIPTIHIKDLASVLQNVIEHQPRPYYLLAVDSSHNSLENLVNVRKNPELIPAVACALGPGKIRKRPFEDIFLIEELNMVEINSLQVNLQMEAVTINYLFSINWHCEFGLVDNVDLVVKEYREARGLLPLRVCILGPPAVGKSTMSSQICKRYKLHHITLKETISKAIIRLEEILKNPDPDAEDQAKEAQELLNSLTDSMENDDVSEDHLKMMRDKLMSNPCKNQGYVLDDFPNMFKQASDLFDVDNDEFPSKSIIPEFVFYLDASDSFLTERVINLPEEMVQDLDYEPEQFLNRLAIYRENNQEDKTVLNFFEDLNIKPWNLEVTSSEESTTSLLMQEIISTLGPPRIYSPSCQEVEEEKRRKTEERIKKEAEERAEEEQREEEEARSRAADWQKWTQSSEEAILQEEQQMGELTAQMRSYLMENVIPTLSQGLIKSCETKPPEPLDVLAEYLFRNNPYEHPK
ncbi:adenylate kinase 7 [Anableps anableps]